MPGHNDFVTRIPYDSLTLSAVVWEMQAFVGAKVQRISQPDDFTVGIGMYSKDAGAGMLLISCHPEFARAYLTTKRLQNSPNPPTFCSTLRARLEGGFVKSVAQIDFDRILELEIEHPEGVYRVIAELMGKHSNIILVDGEKKTITAAKWVGKTKSSRQIQPGGKYHRPPFPARTPIYEINPADLTEITKQKSGSRSGPPNPGANIQREAAISVAGASPFLLKLLQSDAAVLDSVKAVALEGRVHAVLSPGHGGYPISVAILGLKEFSRSSISVALEQHYDAYIPAQEAGALKKSLLGQIRRVILAREVALRDLGQARDLGGRAAEIQHTGELVLAYAHLAVDGAGRLEAIDFDGNPITIDLDPEKTAYENADAFFAKARKAKRSMGTVQDQIDRLSAEKTELESLAVRIEQTEKLEEIEVLQDQARKRHWLHSRVVPSKNKEDRPFEGHRVRELLGPGGWTVFYGENAEANDYLIVRIAKPNDWWLHVRGNTSSHVVISTKNQPEKVGKEVIEYAARIAVQHSVLKHSGYVPVDYTLRKHVRKPRGAAKGTALYTHEKTIHIES